MLKIKGRAVAAELTMICQVLVGKSHQQQGSGHDGIAENGKSATKRFCNFQEKLNVFRIYVTSEVCQCVCVLSLIHI